LVAVDDHVVDRQRLGVFAAAIGGGGEDVAVAVRGLVAVDRRVCNGVAGCVVDVKRALVFG
jgi:hypothetical protein